MSTQDEQNLNSYITVALERYIEAEERLEELAEMLEQYRIEGKKFKFTLNRPSEKQEDVRQILPLIKE